MTDAHDRGQVDGPDGSVHLDVSPPPSPVLTLENIDKSFGATHAVRGVSFDVEARSVVALVGENGAGKSTVGRIIAGVHRPDEGRVLVDGKPRQFGSPHDAIAAGVAMMAQEILLIPDRTVEENVLLVSIPRRGPFPDRRAMRARYRELVELSGFDLEPRARVGDLRVADQQKVEIMRALATDARLIVMDEPSAALTMDEMANLHEAIAAIVERGSSVLLISHFLEEVLDVADSVAIMRDGQLVRVGPTAEETIDSLVAGMVGRSLETHFGVPERIGDAPVRLSVQGLTRKGVLDDVSFDVHAGEIVGLAGLVGAGRSEIARAIFGADPRDGGQVHVDGVVSSPSHPAEAIADGIFMVPESRKDQGLVLTASIRDNMLLSTLDAWSRNGVLGGGRNAAARSLAEQLDLRYASIDQPVGALSGGNQQKTLFGRALAVAPRVLLVDEPTRGVDIAASRAIHRLLEELAASGLAVLFISSELEEVLGVCNRVLVVHRGRITGEFLPPYDADKVLGAFFGGRAEDG